MPLVVPALRLFLLFLNVYESFKTLKPAERSRRTGEQTPRAISQRKRDMKGCMTIWLLWCSLSVVEGFADSTIGIVMPFYSEIKAVIYLFQILTRARGAEPIYLHVMRPLVKPYVATLDWALDSGHLFGDFIILLVSIPVGIVKNWWNPSAASDAETISESSTSATASTESLQEQAAQPQRTRVSRPVQPVNGNGVGLRARTHRQQASESAASMRNAPGRVARPGVPQSRSDAAVNKHKIWRPPSQAQDDEYRRPDRRIASESDASAKAYSIESSTPPIGAAEDEIDEPSMVAGEIDDYPAFPSAYPVTPAAAPKGVKPRPNPKPEALRQNSMNEPRPKQPIQSRTVRGRGRGPIRVPGPGHQTMPARNSRALHSENDTVEVSHVSDFGVSLERLPVSST